MLKSVAVIARNIASIHREKSIDSELISQAILGQPVRIEFDESGWCYVENWDSCHGWVHGACLQRSPASRSNPMVVTTLFADLLAELGPGSRVDTTLVITSVVDLLKQQEDYGYVRLPDGSTGWISLTSLSPEPHQTDAPQRLDGSALMRTAMRFLGVPYLWGGTTPSGIDCSGLVQLAYRICGVSLLRDAAMQASDPRMKIVDSEKMAPGDLVFFGKPSVEGINHVAMAYGDGTIVHSSRNIGVAVTLLEDEMRSRRFRSAMRFSSTGQEHQAR